MPSDAQRRLGITPAAHDAVDAALAARSAAGGPAPGARFEIASALRSNMRSGSDSLWRNTQAQGLDPVAAAAINQQIKASGTRKARPDAPVFQSEPVPTGVSGATIDAVQAALRSNGAGPGTSPNYDAVGTRFAGDLDKLTESASAGTSIADLRNRARTLTDQLNAWALPSGDSAALQGQTTAALARYTDALYDDGRRRELNERAPPASSNPDPLDYRSGTAPAPASSQRQEGSAEFLKKAGAVAGGLAYVGTIGALSLWWDNRRGRGGGPSDDPGGPPGPNGPRGPDRPQGPNGPAGPGGSQRVYEDSAGRPFVVDSLPSNCGLAARKRYIDAPVDDAAVGLARVATPVAPHLTPEAAHSLGRPGVGDADALAPTNSDVASTSTREATWTAVGHDISAAWNAGVSNLKHGDVNGALNNVGEAADRAMIGAGTVMMNRANEVWDQEKARPGESGLSAALHNVKGAFDSSLVNAAGSIVGGIGGLAKMTPEQLGQAIVDAPTAVAGQFKTANDTGHLVPMIGGLVISAVAGSGAGVLAKGGATLGRTGLGAAETSLGKAGASTALPMTSAPVEASVRSVGEAAEGGSAVRITPATAALASTEGAPIATTASAGGPQAAAPIAGTAGAGLLQQNPAIAAMLKPNIMPAEVATPAAGGAAKIGGSPTQRLGNAVRPGGSAPPASPLAAGAAQAESGGVVTASAERMPAGAPKGATPWQVGQIPHYNADGGGSSSAAAGRPKLSGPPAHPGNRINAGDRPVSFWDPDALAARGLHDPEHPVFTRANAARSLTNADKARGHKIYVEEATGDPRMLFDPRQAMGFQEHVRAGGKITPETLVTLDFENRPYILAGLRRAIRAANEEAHRWLDYGFAGSPEMRFSKEDLADEIDEHGGSYRPHSRR